MKKSRFSEEQMVTILREADRTTVAEAAKKHKVSEATWAAAGFDDTLLRWQMKPEVVNGEKKDIQSRVQTRGGQTGR